MNEKSDEIAEKFVGSIPEEAFNLISSLKSVENVNKKDFDAVVFLLLKIYKEGFEVGLKIIVEAFLTYCEEQEGRRLSFDMLKDLKYKIDFIIGSYFQRIDKCFEEIKKEFWKLKGK